MPSRHWLPPSSRRVALARPRVAIATSACLCALLLPSVAIAQARPTPDTGWAQDPPALTSLVSFARSESDLRVAISRYVDDRAAILRRYEVQYSPVRHERLRTLYAGWQARLGEVDFEALNHEGQVDYVLLRHRLAHDVEMLALDERRWACAHRYYRCKKSIITACCCMNS